MAAHSHRLGSQIGVGTSALTLYTTPTGKVTIVKGLQICNRNSVAGSLSLAVFIGATQLSVWREFMTAAGTDGDSITKEIWMVLPAGYSLVVSASASPISVYVSGAELTA